MGGPLCRWGSNGSQWGNSNDRPLPSSNNNNVPLRRRSKRLSDIAEAEEGNDSVLRTPILPIRIKI